MSDNIEPQRITIQLDEDGDIPIWQIQYSNYSPPEINSLWLNKEDAERKLESLADLGEHLWEIQRAWVRGKFDPSKD